MREFEQKWKVVVARFVLGLQKLEKLHKMSYHAFLRDVVKVDQQVLEIFRRWGMSFWCVGSDEIPAASVQVGKIITILVPRWRQTLRKA